MFRKLALNLVVVLTAGTLGIIAYFHYREPIYQGRRYSSYLVDFTSHDQMKREMARAAIGEVGDKALPFLTRTIKSRRSSPDLRAKALRALGVIGSKARPCLPVVINASEDGNTDVRAAALWALGRIPADPERVLALYIRVLDDPNARIRSQAVANLSQMKSKPQKAVPALFKACGDPSGMVRAAATNSLETLGINPPPPPKSITAMFEPPPE